MSDSPRTGPLLSPAQMRFMGTVARLPLTNPFEPAFEKLVKEALGDRYVPGEGVGCSNQGMPSENLRRLEEPVAMAVVPVAQLLAKGAAATEREREVFQGAALFGLWQEFRPRMQQLIAGDAVEVPFYGEFEGSYRLFFGGRGFSVPEPAHLFSLLYQAQRAFFFISTEIRGRSPSAIATRAALYRANLSGDACAYANGLYRHMDEYPVLITGETGTGKEKAAQCIGWSRYVPLDPKTRRLATPYKEDYHRRNLSESPRELVESVLFGHRRGSFTGAVADAIGCFALPKEHGTLFLDEVGELAEHLQVKLLRPLESREILRIGDTRPQKIHGRMVFATNRDPEEECRKGTFREDLYHRMNAIRIRMPSLRRMLAEAPDELRYYIRGFVEEMFDHPAQVEAWTERTAGAIEAAGPGYAWGGNLRALKKFTAAFVVSGGHEPAPGAETAARPAADEGEPQGKGKGEVSRGAPGQGKGAPESVSEPSSELLGPNAKAGKATVSEVTRDLVTRAFVDTNQNISKTALRTGIDRKTVLQKIDPVRLARLLRKRPKKK